MKISIFIYLLLTNALLDLVASKSATNSSSLSKESRNSTKNLTSEDDEALKLKLENIRNFVNAYYFPM